ncbi:siderophore-interacting protein [Leucobacter sp. wl10]|uniref:siderophore-interacting protein n=1 Tax=Leucobacter sp. wl10 TaxID=2304677 RepID=UPI000E5C512E|nr:siderophore-interacting protein [Leucobacter sp. wl10]RGE20170.1 siderophore-interacting protein [Leucobacter sp. wl10]
MTVFAARVVRVRTVSPTLLRVVLGGPGLAGYRASGHPDERLRMYFPEPGSDSAAVVHAATAADLARPERELPLTRRSYTIRNWDAASGLIDVDFAVHDSGPAIAWLRRAQPGDWVGVTEATGWYAPPETARTALIVSDITGLPAVQRIVAAPPPSLERVDVLLDLPHADDAADLPAVPNVHYEVRIGPIQRSPSALAERTTQHPKPGYLWLAAEAAACQSVKRHALHDWGLAPEQHEIRAYWRAGRERAS